MTMTKHGSLTGKPIPPLSEKDRARFWKKVNKTDTCWLWTSAVNNMGYAAFGKGRTCLLAHRVSLHFAGVEIPAGMVVDHLCKVPLCVNPAHLRITTQRINSTENSNAPHAINSRKTHCAPHGHEFTPENTRITKAGGRDCCACRALRARKAA